MTLADALAAAHREQPLRYASRDGDPAIRRKLNSKHQKARASRNRKLTAAELAERIRTLVQRQPRTLSKVQSALRLDGKTTAAAITEGEKSGRLKTVPTARGRRIEPLGDPSPHTRPPEAVDSPHRLARELARHFAAYRAPEGGVAVKGLYYPGGQMVPDLQKFAAEPKTAEGQVARPTGSYRGSQQSQLMPKRPNELTLLPKTASVVSAAPPTYGVLPPDGQRAGRNPRANVVKPHTPSLPSLPPPGYRYPEAANARPSQPKPPAKAKQKPKDDGVPIRNRTRESKRTVIDRLRRLIAKHLTPQRYARGDGEHSHEAFHRSIYRGHYTDRLPSLVYADWLDENGQAAHAEIVRRHQQRAEERNLSASHSFATSPNDERYHVGEPSVESHPMSGGDHLIGVGYSSAGRGGDGSRHVHFVRTSPEDAHRLATQLEAEGVAGATDARIHLERRHPQIFSPPQNEVAVTSRRPIRRD